MKQSNLDTWICQTENLQHLTRSDLETLQLSRLNKILRSQKEQERFYKDLPEHLDSLKDLKTLPFTTPQMLSDQPGKFLQTSQSEISKIISGATSGTTGPAKRVFYTEKDTEHTIGFFAAGISEMAAPGDRVMIAFPFTGPFGLGDLIEQAVLRIGAESIRAGIGKTYEEQCRLLEETKPTCYIGFPAALLSLARFCGSSFPIRDALISGDASPKEVLAQLANLLPGHLYPHYGSREMGLGGAITCPAYEGMHLRENHVIAEIIGPDLQPVPDGEWGELVITTIGLEAMPLIRYRTGDYTRFFPNPCPCGGVAKRLDNVSRITPSFPCIEELDNLMFSIPEMVDYKVSFQENVLSVYALTLNGNSHNAISEKLAEYTQKKEVIFQVEERACRPEDVSLYLAKRYIL